MSNCLGFLCQELSETPSLYIYIQFISGVLSGDILHTIMYQVFLCNTNNSHTVVWVQVFLSNTNDNFVSSNYFYQIIVFCLNTVLWFQVTNNNP